MPLKEPADSRRSRHKAAYDRKTIVNRTNDVDVRIHVLSHSADLRCQVLLARFLLPFLFLPLFPPSTHSFTLTTNPSSILLFYSCPFTILASCDRYYWYFKSTISLLLLNERFSFSFILIKRSTVSLVASCIPRFVRAA